MGHSGEESYGSDGVMDYLDDLGLDMGEDFTQEEVDQKIYEIKQIYQEMDRDDVFDKSDFIGIIIYILEQEKTLPNDILEYTEQLCVELITDKYYLKKWDNPNLRESALLHELDMIRTSMEINDLKKDNK